MAHTPVTAPAIKPAAVSLPVSMIARAGALMLALFVLASGMLFSFGAVLLAPLGMWIAARLQRRRGARLGRAGSWAVAAGATTLGLALLAGVAVWRAPSGTWSHTRAAMDSASAASAAAPPPAWLQRLAPAAAQASAQHRVSSPAVEMGMMVWGAGFGIVMIGSVVGSIGWLAGMLFGYAGTGRWPGAKPLADSATLAV